MDLGNVNVKFVHIKNKNNKHYSTKCEITLKGTEGEIIGIGLSRKLPNDSWNRKTGRKIALRYAINDTMLTRKERTVIWKDYFSLGDRI